MPRPAQACGGCRRPRRHATARTVLRLTRNRDISDVCGLGVALAPRSGIASNLRTHLPLADIAAPQSARLTRRLWPVSGWAVLTVVVAALVSLPVLVVVSRLGSDTDGVWAHLAATVLPDYLANTAALILGVGAIAVTLGVSTAWPPSASLRWPR